MPSDIIDEGISFGKETDDSAVEASELLFKGQILTSVKKFSVEWDTLRQEDLKSLQTRALSGELRTARLRSVAWRILLGILGEHVNWTTETLASRKHYSILKESLSVDPRHPATPPSIDNPLSQHNQSTWNQYFCDSELKSVIQQDVIRTFPNLDFFRNRDIQQVMVNILFCYAREHPTMCYRQGMHEVLAPILFVLSCDHQALLHLRQQTDIDPEICDLLNPDFLEEDGYIIFGRIMDSIKTSYHITNIAPLATGHFPSRASLGSGGSCENQVVSQLNSIKENILAPNDPQLCNHLEQLDIPLPLFAIRWLRLLFGREFPLEDLLVLWDSIFAYNHNFDLVNYIVVAMLIAVRSHLLMSDYTTCLSHLMRYPGTMDISYIIEYALYLREPEKYTAPKSSGLSILSRRDHRAPTKKVSPQKYQKQSTSDYRSQPSALTPAPVEGRSIIEGYSPHDPLVLEGELKNAHRLMAICRLKLSQYHAVLDPVIPPDDEAAQQALAGIQQLCRLLDPGPSCVSVEVATDAVTVESPVSPTVSPPRPISKQRKPSVDMTVFKQECPSFPAPDLPVDCPYS